MSEGLILTVCTGNVCRSPLLERLLQRALDDTYGPGAIPVRSAGTGALVGHEMDERSAGVLRGLGGEPDGFVARRLTPDIVRSAALIVAATRDHRAEAVRSHPRALKRAFTLGELASILRHLDPADRPRAEDPVERVHEVAAVATAHRGMIRPASWDEFDLADPYRREDHAYVDLEDAVRRDLPPLLEALGARHS